MRALRSALALLLAGSLAGCAAGGYQNSYGYPGYGYPGYVEPGYGVAYGPTFSFGTGYPYYYYGGGYPYWQQPYWHNWNNGHWNNGRWNNGNWNNGSWNSGHWTPPPNNWQGNGQGRPPGNKPPGQWANQGGTVQNPLLNRLNSGHVSTGSNVGRGIWCRECE
jgi:hypothetical protein